MKNILIVGAGGREHVVAWKFRQSNLCNQLYIAPGNAGTAKLGTNVPIKTTDFEGLSKFCIDYEIDLLFVGPEDPLVKGIYDFFVANPITQHIQVIGPSKAAAQLEGSKAFAKEFMKRHEVPTAAYKEFTKENYAEGVDYIKNHALPIVIKADGLAAGKGVVICNNKIEALAEFELMIMKSKFGEAGNTVVIEAFLDGIELSVFALTDGKEYVMLPSAKDYKKIGKGDTGPNTGGMGAVSPVPFVDEVFLEKIIKTIVAPTIAGLHKEQLVYKGFVFFGLIKVGDDPFVIEYNCRMGDPESEVVFPRIESDLVELLEAVSQQRLNEITMKVNPLTAATVMAVSGGYPNDHEIGFEISGLVEMLSENSLVFHAGTRQINQQVVTNGGRVLAVTSFGQSIPEAVAHSVAVLKKIHFDEMYFRPDIGFEFY